jgi:CubicO group peptidase (beta-lactamase class C family)
VRTITQLIIFCVALLVASLTARQERVTTRPPPEIRALVDAVTAAVLGGSPDVWESMARERFAPDLLAKQTVAERRQVYDKLITAFAGSKRGPVMRQGPDAPLELQMVGPSGPAGAIVLELTDGMPPRISGISIETAATPRPSDPEAPPPPPISPAMTKAELAPALDAYLRRSSDEGRLSGVALVARDTDVWFEGAYGLAVRGERPSKPVTTQFKVGAVKKAFTQTVVEQGSDIANTVATRFNICSINKAFTRMAIEQLVAQKRLSRSETLGTLIPDYPQIVSRAATIDQLVNHTAGIADFFGPVFNETPKDRFRSNEDYFRFVSELPPTFAPGARNQYCNGCYIVLGALVERIAKVPYERYVTEHVFAPAGMKQTSFVHADANEPGVATGYTTRGADGVLRSNVLMHGVAGSAAGGSYSTARDLLAFVAAQRDGRLPGGGMTQIAGGAPGTNAVLLREGAWTVVVLTNLDPPFGERTGEAIMRALASGR